MIVWMIDQKLHCPDCGTRQEEWDPAKGGEFHAYHISRYQCLMCKNIEEAYEDERKKSSKKRIPSGFKVRLVPHYVWLQRAQVRRELAIRRARDTAKDAAETQSRRRIATATEYGGLELQHMDGQEVPSK